MQEWLEEGRGKVKTREEHKGGDVCTESLMVSSSCPGERAWGRHCRERKWQWWGQSPGVRQSSASHELLTSVSWSLQCWKEGVGKT